MVTYRGHLAGGLKNYGIRATTRSRRSTWAREKSVEGLTHAYARAAKIGSGLRPPRRTCKAQRTVEFELKAQVMKPMKCSCPPRGTNAEIFRMETEIGSVEPGKYADLLVVKGNPLKDSASSRNQDNLLLIDEGGRRLQARV